MKTFKYLVRETLRVLKQYTTAIRVEAKGRPLGVISSTFQIMLARILYGIGPLYYSLYRLSQVPRHEWGNYITDGPDFKQFLHGLNPETLREVGNDKLKFYLHCVRNGLPTIPVICVFASKPGLGVEEVEWICTPEQWRAKMLLAPTEMFIKPIDGTYGEGAFMVSRRGDQFDFDGQSGSVDDLYRCLNDKLRHERAWLVQPRMRSHSSLDGIASPQGLATVRVVTHMRHNKAELLIADLKITVGDNLVDNFSKGKSGNLLAGIDRNSGALGLAWGSSQRDWPVMVSHSHHPDSGKLIQGYRLPFWDELAELALKAQESLPDLKTLGWDIAATHEGVMLVEANITYDVSILQIAHQRGLKRDFYTALDTAG